MLMCFRTPLQKLLYSPESQLASTQEEVLCILKSCQTLYLTHLPPKTTCSWKLCNDPLVQGMPGIPGAYIAETHTDTHMSVRTKRWQFADSLQMCMNLECVGLSGNDLYQCAYSKCVFVESS